MDAFSEACSGAAVIIHTTALDREVAWEGVTGAGVWLGSGLRVQAVAVLLLCVGFGWRGGGEGDSLQACKEGLGVRDGGDICVYLE